MVRRAPENGDGGRLQVLVASIWENAECECVILLILAIPLLFVAALASVWFVFVLILAALARIVLNRPWIVEVRGPARAPAPRRRQSADGSARRRAASSSRPEVTSPAPGTR